MGGVAVDVDAGGVKAPDGGWGWAVLAGCFVITGFSYAFPKAVSVFFKELIREFGVGYSDTAWISSILLAMLYGTGNLQPPEAALANPAFATLTGLLSRSSVQRAGEPLRLSPSDDGGWPLRLAGNDPGLVLHQHHPHLPLHRGYYRSLYLRAVCETF